MFSNARILHILSALGVGGAEAWLADSVGFLYEQGLPVHFDFCLTGRDEGVFERHVLERGSRIFRVPYSRREILKFRRGLRDLFRVGNFAAVHHHQDLTAGIHFALVGRSHLPPIRIAHVHNAFVHIEAYRRGLTRHVATAAGRYLTPRLATTIAGTSAEVLRQYFDEDVAARARVVYCGIRTENFLRDRAAARATLRKTYGWSADKRIILFVGRLDAHENPRFNQKNPTFLLEIARHLRERKCDAGVLVAGAQGNFPLAHSAGKIGPDVVFTGIHFDVPLLLAGSDLLLVPSIAEGLGRVVVEAQAAGIRVLASTGVPKEASLVPDAVCFRPLHLGAESWAEQAASMIALTPLDLQEANDRVRESPFGMANSVRALLGLYSHEDTPHH